MLYCLHYFMMRNLSKSCFYGVDVACPVKAVVLAAWCPVSHVDKAMELLRGRTYRTVWGRGGITFGKAEHGLCIALELVLRRVGYYKAKLPPDTWTLLQVAVSPFMCPPCSDAAGGGMGRLTSSQHHAGPAPCLDFPTTKIMGK